MAVLRIKDIKNMDEKTKKEKLKDLKMELVKASVSANRANAKTKEIKRAIARLMTYHKLTKSHKEEVRK